MSTLGDIIYGNRRRCGWTQAQLAEQIGVSQTAVSQMESAFHEHQARQKVDALLRVFGNPPDLMEWWADDRLNHLETLLAKTNQRLKDSRRRRQPNELLAKLEEVVNQSRKVHTALLELQQSLQEKKAS